MASVALSPPSPVFTSHWLNYNNFGNSLSVLETTVQWVYHIFAVLYIHHVLTSFISPCTVFKSVPLRICSNHLINTHQTLQWIISLNSNTSKLWPSSLCLCPYNHNMTEKISQSHPYRLLIKFIILTLKQSPNALETWPSFSTQCPSLIAGTFTCSSSLTSHHFFSHPSIQSIIILLTLLTQQRWETTRR